MKEAIVSAGPAVEIVDSPVPKPGPDEILIRVVAAAANPKDWKVPEWTGKSANQGEDCAGVVEAIGRDVSGFKAGDRVAGLHKMGAPGGTYAEYAVCPAHTVFHIRPNTSFEAACTVPLTAGTAAIGLFGTVNGLALPLPVQPISQPLPLVIYGASGSVGSFAVQLASKANIHPLICVGGGSIGKVEQFLDVSKGDKTVDYRKGDVHVVDQIKAALKGVLLRHGLDTVARGSSSVNIAAAMAEGGKIARTLPPEDAALPDGVEQFQLSVYSVFTDSKDLGFLLYQLFGLGLRDAWLQTRPYGVVPGGIGGVQQALANLKGGKANKYVFRIAETEGVSETVGSG